MIRKEDLEQFKDVSVNIDDFMNFIYQNNLEDYTQDIVPDEEVQRMMEDRLKNSDWKAVHIMMRQVSNINRDYYFVDGYSNIRDILLDDIHNIVSEIEDNYNFSSSKEEELF